MKYRPLLVLSALLVGACSSSPARVNHPAYAPRRASLQNNINAWNAQWNTWQAQSAARQREAQLQAQRTAAINRLLGR
jgi:hypothetical protein